MTREIIENYRFILIPYMVNRFKEINYEGQGDSDAKEFMNDFNELCDLALKALEQEPNKDCISRAQAIKCLECDFKITGRENMKTVVNYINSVHNKIVRLPPVTPQEPRWIPVSERLPKPNAKDGLTARYYLIRNEYEDMLVARYDGMGWTQMYQHEYLEDDVIAWMPLPQAYREVEK